MPNDIVLSGPTQQTDGVLSADSFTIERTGSLHVTVNLSIVTYGSISIFGEIVCDPGVSLVLSSAAGYVAIRAADVTAGQGIDATVPGGFGGPAGTITIKAPNNTVFIMGCAVRTLRGGHGKDAKDLPSKTDTRGGGGGRGGNIRIEGRAVTLVDCTLETGDGGD